MDGVSGIITVKQGHSIKHENHNLFPTHAMLPSGKFGTQISSRKVSTKNGIQLSHDLVQVIDRADSEDSIERPPNTQITDAS